MVAFDISKYRGVALLRYQVPELRYQVYEFFFVAVSMQTLAADVQGLRKGLDLTKNERDKQPNNFIVFVSFLCYLASSESNVCDLCV